MAYQQGYQLDIYDAALALVASFANGPIPAVGASVKVTISASKVTKTVSTVVYDATIDPTCMHVVVTLGA